MVNKCLQWLEKKNPESPALVIDLSIVKKNFFNLKNLYKNIEVFYAVKANPNKRIIRQILTKTAINLWTFKLIVWKSIIGSIKILNNNAKTKGIIIGWEKLRIKATAILANINRDPEITLLLSFINYLFDLGLKISGLSFWKFSK